MSCARFLAWRAEVSSGTFAFTDASQREVKGRTRAPPNAVACVVAFVPATDFGHHHEREFQSPASSLFKHSLALRPRTFLFSSAPHASGRVDLGAHSRAFAKSIISRQIVGDANAPTNHFARDDAPDRLPGDKTEVARARQLPWSICGVSYCDPPPR